jgi:hypothetical protein
MTQNRFDIKADQYALCGDFGITDRVDVAVAIPFEHFSMSAALNGTEYSVHTGSTASVHEYIPGSASGISDIVIGFKGNIYASSLKP